MAWLHFPSRRRPFADVPGEPPDIPRQQYAEVRADVWLELAPWLALTVLALFLVWGIGLLLHQSLGRLVAASGLVLDIAGVWILAKGALLSGQFLRWVGTHAWLRGTEQKRAALEDRYRAQIGLALAVTGFTLQLVSGFAPTGSPVEQAAVVPATVIATPTTTVAHVPAAASGAAPTSGFDPNWFYSSLAQSAAALIGLFGAVMMSRLMDQRSQARGEWSQLVPRINELRANVADVLPQVKAALTWTADVERNAANAHARGATSFAVPTRKRILSDWHVGGNPMGLDDTSEQRLKTLADLYRRAEGLLSRMNEDAIKNPADTWNTEARALATDMETYVGTVRDGNESDIPALQQWLKHWGEKFNDLRRDYQSFRAGLVPQSMYVSLGILAVMSVVSVIVPLGVLSGHADWTKPVLLVAFATLALGLLAFLAYLVRELNQVGRI